MRILLSLIAASLFCFQIEASTVQDIEQNIQKLGFERFHTQLVKNRLKDNINHYPVKIAVFDYGFDGFEAEKGRTIPHNTEYKQRPGDTDFRSADNKNTHGLAMAQILTQYTTKDYKRWSLVPKIYLYKSNGYSNFQWSIDDAIKNGVDIVLHSIVIEYGSNYDGHGFYNALVNRATNAGLIWVNAAGNFGETTFNSQVLENSKGWADLGITNNALPVTCKIPNGASTSKRTAKKCNVRVVLAWDDFKNRPLSGSEKNLDLYMYDGNLNPLVSSSLRQVQADNKNKTTLGFTLYPREIIETVIPEGTSYLKVKISSDNFSPNDKLRITADGDNISFPIRDEDESLLNPADNLAVITVGESSGRSSVSKSLNKPELVAPSLVKGDDGQFYMGSSNAAAVVASGIVLMKELNPELNREQILDLILPDNGGELLDYSSVTPKEKFITENIPQELNAAFVQSDQMVPIPNDPQNIPPPQVVRRSPPVLAIPLKVFGFGPPPQVGCFPLADIKVVEPCIIADFIINSRSLLVATTSGLKIATSFDPIKLIPGDVRLDIRDMIAVFPHEREPFKRLPRNFPLPLGAIEIFKLPLDEAVCKLPDWDFLMTELEVSRRRIYEANSVGVANLYVPQSCSVDSLMTSHYPMSDWRMYPVLQQTPYTAPVGPAPVDRSRYHRYNDNFRMPPPSNLERN